MANPIPNLWRIPELKEKILFTLLCLAVYRFGAHITVPGVDVVALQATQGALQGTLFGLYDMFVGGGLQRATVFALGIMPYISASIMFQLLGPVFPTIERMQREGEEGRRRITQWTRYATVALCLAQGYGYAIYLQGLNAGAAAPVVSGSLWGFRLMTVLTLTTGGIFIMWLGEQITEGGVGNGMSLLIFFSILEGFPAAVARTVEAVDVGTISLFRLIILLAVMVGVVAGVVAMTMGARRIPVQIPRKVVGRGRIREGTKTFIPLRVNSAGVMPIIFAQSIIVVPGTLSFFSNVPWLQDVSRWFQPQGSTAWVYYVTYMLLIVFFTYFYTAIIFNPVDVAENLKKQGAFIPGVKPGLRTAEYVEQVLARITFPGALFLALIALLPFWIFDLFDIQLFFFGGTALLIVVGVALDTVQQLQQHLLLRHYEGFMKKGRVKYTGRRRM